MFLPANKVEGSPPISSLRASYEHSAKLVVSRICADYFCGQAAVTRNVLDLPLSPLTRLHDNAFDLQIPIKYRKALVALSAVKETGRLDTKTFHMVGGPEGGGGVGWEQGEGNDTTY